MHVGQPHTEVPEGLPNSCEDMCATVIYFSENPPSFSCYRDKGHNNEGIVTYSGCQVITDFMDARSGIFTVKRGGVYRQVQTTSI